MSVINVDVAIIGAGPGGAMAAYTLAQTGLRVLILEKEHLPRAKSCGGLISGSVLELFDWNISEVIEKRVSKIDCFYDFGQAVSSTITGEPPLLVNRSRFDNHLVGRALKKGSGNIRLLEGCPVRDIKESSKGVIVKGAKGETVHADYCILAHGANSRITAGLGIEHQSPRGMAVNAEVEVSRELYERYSDRITFNYFCLPDGYGWIFPKRDGLLSCGVGCLKGKVNLKKEINRFLSKSFSTENLHDIRLYGHPIPVYSGRRRYATARTCLVGDAASLVDPVTGEGIRYALKSGQLAARVIAQLEGVEMGDKDLLAGSSEKKRSNCYSYEKIINRTVGSQLENRLRFVSLVFHGAPELFYDRFVVGNSE